MYGTRKQQFSGYRTSHSLYIKQRKPENWKLTMHKSLLEIQRMQDQASFSKLTRRARRMARAPRKQSAIQKNFYEKDFKKLTFTARQIARPATLAPSTRQISALESFARRSSASSPTDAPNFCREGAAPNTCSISEYSPSGPYHQLTNNLANRGVTSSYDEKQRALNQRPMSGQLHGPSSQPYSSLLLSAFAIGAAWATKSGPPLTLPVINCLHQLPLGGL